MLTVRPEVAVWASGTHRFHPQHAVRGLEELQPGKLAPGKVLARDDLLRNQLLFFELLRHRSRHRGAGI